MTTIFLIRHGATVLTREDRFAGSTDVELSDEGRSEVARLGKRLATTKLSAIYCSDLRRTVDTANAIAGPHGLTPLPRPSLREIDHGHWEKQLLREVIANHPAEYQAWEADPLLVAPPGGETGLGVLARSLPELGRIVTDHPNQSVAVVSHKATNRLLLCSILGIDPRLYRERLGQYPACLNIIEFRDNMRGRVTLMNDISHYVST
jgi:probable phosphoglycerate mutase